MRPLLYLLLFTTLSLPAQELVEVDSKPLDADRFLGYDAYGNLFYLKNMALYKTGPLGDFFFQDFSLGPVESVDIINPLNVVVFYRDTQAVVFLDNRLNEIERIELSAQSATLNVDAVTNTGNNRLWVFNVDTQQVETYNYRNQRQTVVSQPTTGELRSVSSDFNYYYLLMDNGLHAFNVYGSALWRRPFEGYDRVLHQGKRLLLTRGNELFLTDSEGSSPKAISMAEIPVSDLQLSKDFLYIYDGESVRQFTLNQQED